jgi:uncharacterized protein
VAPFLNEAEGELEVAFLRDPDGRVLRFLERLLKLMRRLEGRPRNVVREALRRQERRVRDARRLSGLSRTLLTLGRFTRPEGADRAEEVREALFRARGAIWPPVTGDDRLPYETAGLVLNLPADEVDRLLYADDPEAFVLRRAPRLSAKALLRRYNLDLARAVLLDAEEVTVRAKGGWGDLFRAIKLARLMHRIEPAGRRGYRIILTGPAAAFVTRPRRYGIRFARVVPALVRAPGWSLEARVVHEGRRLRYRISRSPELAAGRGRRARFDSRWEADLAEEFRGKLGDERDGWTLHREDVPVQMGEDIFLPDFTVRHADGRTALVELVGFWTPEYLDEKLRKVQAAGLENLVLVVFRGLAAAKGEGGGLEEAFEALPGAVVWFAEKVRIGPVMEAVERVAR